MHTAAAAPGEERGGESQESEVTARSRHTGRIGDVSEW